MVITFFYDYQSITRCMRMRSILDRNVMYLCQRCVFGSMAMAGILSIQAMDLTECYVLSSMTMAGILDRNVMDLR